MRKRRAPLLSTLLLLSLVVLPLAGEPAWAACGQLLRTPACGVAPSALFDKAGQLWVAYVDDGHVYLSRSRDLGATFEPALTVNQAPEAIYADGENRPMLAFGRQGEIFVAWTRRNGEPYSGDIRFARSLDGGRHFEAPRTVNDDGLVTSHRFVAMMATPAGPLYLAWLDKRDQVAALADGLPYAGAALYYTVSLNGGSSFAPNRKVADHSCECCRLALAPNGGDSVQALWRQVFEDGTVRDHATAALGPRQATGARRATWDNWRLDGCPHHGPAIAAADGGQGWHLAWFSNGDKGRGVLYGFHDARTGDTERTLALDPRPNGGHPAIAARGDALTLAWLSFDGAALNVLVSRSPDGGRHWSPAEVFATTAGSADHPQLLWRGASLYLSWHTSLDGYRFLPLPGQ